MYQTRLRITWALSVSRVLTWVGDEDDDDEDDGERLEEEEGNALVFQGERDTWSVTVEDE